MTDFVNFSRTFNVPKIKPMKNEIISAIGDIHGNFHLMREMVKQLGERHPGSRLVFLGDMITRGPDSASCLLFAWHLAFENPHPFSKVDIVLGNHEHMFFAPLVSIRFDFSYPFWPSPTKKGHWMENYFSAETIAEDGFMNALEDSEYGHEIGAERCQNLYKQWMEYAFLPFKDGVPPMLQSPVFKRSGNIIFVHAGVNPKKNWMKKFAKYNILNHSIRDFQTSPMWIKKIFVDGLKTHPPLYRGKEMFVVHGHTIDKKKLPNGWIDIQPKTHRLCIDTGAYDTGILTSATFSEGQIEILEIKTA